MADNFRNKQWFKNLSQERKDKICKTFDIDETTLKKAGRETNDGRIVVDLLRIDHINTTPDIWNTCYNALKTSDVFLDDISDIDLCKMFYKIFVPNVIFLKYKDSLSNNIFVEYAAKYTKNWYTKFIDNDSTNEEKKFYAYQVWSHVKYLIESDLKLVKNND